MPHGLCAWLESTAAPVAERNLDRLGLDLSKVVGEDPHNGFRLMPEANPRTRPAWDS